VNADEEAAYKQAVKDFDELRGILPKFAQKRAWLRPADDVSDRIQRSLPPGTVPSRGAVRDAAVCALTNKACNTHAAVRMLTDAGNADDAMVLTRVIVETTVLLQWILRDRIYRLDLYCLSSALFKRHWIELVREYFSAEPDVVAMAEQSLDSSDAALVQAAFGNTNYRWARERKQDGRFEDFNVEKMMKEIAVGDGSNPPSHFLYDVIYHMHSAYAHGTSEGMQQFRTLARLKTFTCELGFNDGQSALALQGANTYLAWLLQGTCNYLGFDDIDREIDEWFERMKAGARALADSRARATT
jgi:Family of unknown function (DUF5677)